nr:ProQ/FINO family protein [Facilibium subflavum]
MSDGRDKLHDFSLLKSLVGGKSIKDKTDRMRKAHEDAKKRGGAVHSVQDRAASGSKAASKGGRAQSSKNMQARQQTRQARVNQSRSPFCMPQFGQKQPAELTVEAPGDQSEQIVIEIDVAKQRAKEEQRLFKWLCQRFPKCFNPRDKRPLKIGISDDIETVYQNEHFAPVDQYVLRNVIKRYVGDTRYQRSVLDYKQRFDLYGKPVEDFSPEHLEYAQKRLDEIAEKAQLRAQGIDIKAYYQQKRQMEQQEGQDVSTASDDVDAQSDEKKDVKSDISGGLEE